MVAWMLKNDIDRNKKFFMINDSGGGFKPEEINTQLKDIWKKNDENKHGQQKVRLLVPWCNKITDDRIPSQQLYTFQRLGVRTYAPASVYLPFCFRTINLILYYEEVLTILR